MSEIDRSLGLSDYWAVYLYGPRYSDADARTLLSATAIRKMATDPPMKGIDDFVALERRRQDAGFSLSLVEKTTLKDDPAVELSERGDMPVLDRHDVPPSRFIPTAERAFAVDAGGHIYVVRLVTSPSDLDLYAPIFQTAISTLDYQE